MSAADSTTRGEITRLLLSWSGGDRDSFDRLFPLVYDALRDLARRQLRRRSQAATLHTTDLVHEAYLKLVDPARVSVQDRNHFFALAARAMRQILVDHARRRSTDKRGGGVAAETLQDWDAAVMTHPADILAVDQALGRLEALDDRLGRLVEMRFFGGLSVEETAGALGVSERTVKRDWQKARAFLYRELHGTAPP